MKRITCSIAAPVLLGLCFSVCSAAFAQGGHSQPDTGGGPPGGGTAGEVVANAVSTFGQATTTTSGATVTMSQMANTDNEGQSSGGTDYCVSTPDNTGGSFDYTTTLTITNTTQYDTNVAWSVPLSVSGYVNYAKGSASSKSQLQTVGPTDNCGPYGSYGSAPSDSQTVPGLTSVSGYSLETVNGTASGSTNVGI